MNTSLPVVDRDGVLMRPGQQLEIQHCLGYGQTVVIKGQLIEIDRYQGASITLSEPTIWHAKVGRTQKKAGDQVYVVLRGTIVDGKYVCMHTHDDFEQGQEAWARVVAPKAPKPQELPA